MNLETFLDFNDIKSIYISNDISNFNLNIDLPEYNIDDDLDENVLFCGMYTYNDYNTVKNHKGKKWILWCGNDIDIQMNNDMSIKKTKRYNNILSLKTHNIEDHLALNNKCYYNLYLLDIKCKINLNNNNNKIAFKIIIPKNINKIYILILINNAKENIKFSVADIFFSNKYNKVNLVSNNLWTKCSDVELNYDPNGCISVLCKNDSNVNCIPNGIQYKIPIAVTPGDEYFFSLIGASNSNLGDIKPLFISDKDETVYTNNFNDNITKRYSQYDHLRLINNDFNISNIKQIYISDEILYLKPQIINKFGFNDYNNQLEDTIFFGIYNITDIEIINKHSGRKYLIWEGVDSLFDHKKQLYNLKQLCNDEIIHIAISDDIENILLKWQLNPIRIDFNFTNTELFKPSEKVGYKIFIYNGYTKGSEELYGKNLYDIIVNGLPDYEFIFSNQLDVPYEEMSKIYSECFIGLRFTKFDGNINMIHEMQAMNIPVVNNLNRYGLKYVHISDITSYIKYYDPFKFTFKDALINNDNLDNFNSNIDEFTELISEYKNILFICGDYPGFGGAATNCRNLQTFYSNNHNTYTIYFNFDDDICNKYASYCIINKSEMANELKNLNFIPDLIILKSFVSIDLKQFFKCPIFYCIGGIYKNNLSKYYYELNKYENDLYVNESVIRQIKYVDKSFSNSRFTQELLKKKFNIDTLLFYSGFVPFYKNEIINDKDEFINRKYDYGLIISDFNRPIKNIDKSINILKNKKDKNIILIGKNSSKYANDGFVCKNLVDYNELNKYYKQIKYIQQDSFYESFSNVRIESIFNGCKFNKNIVVSSTQYPGYGGAATNAYALIKYLRYYGFNTVGLFFHTDHVLNYDPDNIGGIYIFHREYDSNHVKNTIVKYLGSMPDICIAKNYMAPIYCKNIFNCYTIYLVSGINHFYLYYDNISANELLDDSFIIDKEIEMEIECNKKSDLIILNSLLSKKIFQKIYPNINNKIYSDTIDTTSIMSITKFNIVENKEFDILICCSNLERLDKNNLFFIDIFSNSNFDKYKKCIIGSNYNQFLQIPNTFCFGLLEQKECIEYMSKSKLLLFPSFFDANSNTVRESYYNKCLPLITNNVGFSELFPEFLICNSFEPKEWESKILYILNNYDNLKNTKINYQTECNKFKELINNIIES